MARPRRSEGGRNEVVPSEVEDERETGHATAFDGTRFVCGQTFALTWLSIMRAAVMWDPARGLLGSEPVLADLVIDLICVALITIAYILFNPVFMSTAKRIMAVAGIIVVSFAVFRLPLTFLTGRFDLTTLTFKQLFITVLVVLLAAAGLFLADMEIANRMQGRAMLAARSRAAESLERMTRRELEVRSDISRRLHGSLQQSILLAERRVRDIQRLPVDGPADIALVRSELETLAKTLRTVREQEVRDASQALRPTAIELGAPQAIRHMLSRLPSSIAVAVHIDERFENLERMDAPSLDLTIRLLLIEIVQEAVSNALKHGKAERLDLRIDIVDAEPLYVRVVVRDDGRGSSEPLRSLRGLAELERQARVLHGRLELVRSADGAELIATVPLQLRGPQNRQVSSAIA